MIRLLAVPYHFGRERVGVGLGPVRIASALPYDVRTVRRHIPYANAKSAIASVNGALAGEVASAAGAGEIPVVLAGNCSSCLGVLAGLDCAQTGIVWFDAHGDFHTPETSTSGSIDGMALAIATGHCHQALWRGSPVEECQVVLAGTRDLDPPEEERLHRSEIQTIPAAEIADAVKLLPVPDVYLHVDLDVIDRAESPGVNCMAPGGVPVETLTRAIESIASTRRIAAALLANYNPARDGEGRTLGIAARLVELIRELTL